MSSKDPYTVPVKKYSRSGIAIERNSKPSLSAEEWSQLLEQISDGIETVKLQIDEQVPPGRQEQYEIAEESLGNFVDGFIRSLSAVSVNDVKSFRANQPRLAENFAQFAKVLEQNQIANVAEVLSEPDFIVDNLAEQLLFVNAGQNLVARTKLKKVGERQKFVEKITDVVCDIWTKAMKRNRFLEISSNAVCKAITQILKQFIGNVTAVVQVFPYIAMLLGSIGLIMSYDASYFDPQTGINLSEWMENALKSEFISKYAPAWERQILLDSYSQLKSRFTDIQGLLQPSWFEKFDYFNLLGRLPDLGVSERLSAVFSSFNVFREYDYLPQKFSKSWSELTTDFLSIFIKTVALTSVSQAPRTIAISLSKTIYKTVFRELLDRLPNSGVWRVVKATFDGIIASLESINNAASMFFLLSIMSESIISLSFYAPGVFLTGLFGSFVAVKFGNATAEKLSDRIDEYYQKPENTPEFKIYDTRTKKEEQTPERKPDKRDLSPVRRRNTPIRRSPRNK